MKYSVGYQFFDEHDQPFIESLCKMSERIEEVYFPWMDFPTCRKSLATDHGYKNWSAQSFFENDLHLLLQSGIKLNLLFNANCYGEKSISLSMKNHICSIIDHILDTIGPLDTVTTTSLYIASIIKEKYPFIKVRASVNMKIGTIQGMEYLADLFDGYYIQRDYNRNIQYLCELKKWTEKNRKSLHLLANSGCMRHCSGQIFHDNLVSHEDAILDTHNDETFQSALCWNYYQKQEHWVNLLQSTWIRPEDIHHYQSLFDSVKLATRMTSRPLTVVKAYLQENYHGNLLDLLEPNHTPLLQQMYIDNKKFPEDWFQVTSTCNENCSDCGYCQKVFQNVLTQIPPVQFFEENISGVTNR